MSAKNAVKRTLGILLYCIVVISMTWTFLTTIVFVRAHYRSSPKRTTEIRVWPAHGALLPRYGNDSTLLLLADSLGSFADRVVRAKSDSLADTRLVNASISFSVVDATYFYRLIFIGECGCPLTTTNRYEIDLAYMNPRTFEVFREERHRGLSAEDVKRFDELLTFERR